MDGSRFDQLARTMASGRTRRGFLGGLAALAAGVVAAGRVEAVACPPGQVAASGGRCLCKATGRPPVGGACPCGAGQSDCGGVCKDLSSDVTNCGVCGNVCPGPTPGTCQGPAACRGGICTFAPLPAGTVCRTSTGGPCDPAETCDGVSLECPPDTPAPAGTPCGGTGACAGSCAGTTPTCVFPGGETVCGDPSCTNGVGTLAAVCDGTGACAPPATEVCSPGLCVGTACSQSCSSDENCDPAGYCDLATFTCTMDLAQGSECTRTAQCAAPLTCVDGVCCDAACTGQCEACNLTGTVGTCTPVPANGAPVVGTSAGRSACATDGSVCGGTCSGNDRTACAYPSASLVCAFPACVAGDAASYTCNGSGACAEQRQDCGLRACRDGACVATCQSATDCAAPVCIDGEAASYTCDQSGNCVEQRAGCGLGVCRDGACLSVCHSNDDCVPEAHCGIILGTTGICFADFATGQAGCENDDECLSGHCVRQVCCANACPPPANGSTTCVDGGSTCRVTCNDGFFRTADGQCINQAACSVDTDCGAGSACHQGSCVVCRPGSTPCSGNCVRCAGGTVSGACTCSCPAGKTLCHGDCADLATDPNHCGHCDLNCNGGTCSGGVCVCGGSEVCQTGETCFHNSCNCCGNGNCDAFPPPADGGPVFCMGGCLGPCALGETCTIEASDGDCLCGGITCPIPIDRNKFVICIEDTCCIGPCAGDEQPVPASGTCACQCGSGPLCGQSGLCVSGQCRCGDGVACGSGQHCTFAMCCPTGQTNCGGVCKNTSSDPAFCGPCVNCGAGATCSNGGCICSPGAPACPLFEHCVNGTCRCGNLSGSCPSGSYCHPDGFCYRQPVNQLAVFGRR